jgi:hypothetical protein
VPGRNRHQRSAAIRFVVFGAAHALKDHELSWTAMTRCIAADLIRLPNAEVRTGATSFDFIEVTALSGHRNDADVPSFVTNL